MIRLFVGADLGPAGSQVPLAKDQAHYLLNVMRQKPGARIAVFNGRDGEALAVLRQAGREAALEIETPARGFSPPPDLWLVVALVKRGPLETIVEKATELGVRRIQLITTLRTNAERTNVDRLQKIAVEAAEQTGRLDVPEVADPDKLERVLDGWDEGRRLMFCDEAGDDPATKWGGPEGRANPALEALAEDLPPPGEVRPKAGKGAPARDSAGVSPPPPASPGAPPKGGRSAAPWAVLIGPEGGFDPAERARLRSLPYVTPVTLGPRILRADTAAIAALALWQAALGDFGA
jgi:16S rRNA (uracil1498-N3)-methyltransferase